MEPLRTTIVFPLRDDQVLLGMKKRGFGEGWWNGFGGKLDKDEAFQEAAIRETREESGIEVNSLRLVGRLLFSFGGELGVVSMAYVTDDFSGVAVEKDEMKPAWFATNNLPYDQMWPADRLWVPAALSPDVPEIQEFAIQFDNDKRFLEMNPAEQNLLDYYLPIKQ
ncbi:8-oxo-dGTP diphosphatase [Candidatus Saccharibacteria bacterium]|nr:8-oxo-dGTP diphosphatase [Candidatus Saccharibacteria bacterium]